MAIQIRRGTDAEWESNNSNIVVGEPAIATDAERFFVGTASGDYAEFINLDVIAPAYDTSYSYAVGDVINRQGKLYSCNTPCSGAFNISYWDEKSLAEILKDLENEITYAQYEIGYADGELITIDNGASEIPVKDLTLAIEAVQSGTGDPSSENIRPISGWTGAKVTRTGKNIFGGDLLKDGVKNSLPSATIDEDAKTIKFASTATVAVSGFNALSGLTFKENTRYTFIMTYNKQNTSVTSNMRIYYTDGTNDVIPSITSGQTKETVVLVSDANKTVYSLVKNNSSNYTVLYYDESGVFEGVLTKEDFEPYNGQTYSVTWEEAGTVYGGTLDVTTGELVVTFASIDLTQNMNVGDIGGIYVYYKELSPLPKVVSNSEPANVIAEAYKKIRYNGVTGSIGTIAIRTNNYIYVNTGDRYVAPIGKAIYELATPQTVQLTPTQVRTLLGTNNLWNSMNSNNELAYRISNALN